MYLRWKGFYKEIIFCLLCPREDTGIELLFLCFYFISFLCDVHLSCNFVAVAASWNQILIFVLSIF